MRIRLPRETATLKHYYRKVGTRRAQAISKVCFAGVRNAATGETRIALGSVAPIPLRCRGTEAAIREGRDAAAALADGNCANQRHTLDVGLPPACGAESAA